MTDWPALLTRPADFNDGQTVLSWFSTIADALMNGTRLFVGKEPHRLVEIEFYYHGEGHLDAFAHRDPIQLHCGRWYFHRTAGVYRSGSFKGLDLSFGDGKNHAGILFRGLETPEGDVIDGPSLLVDHLLDRTGAETVAQLDRAIGDRVAWDETNPLSLRDVEETEPRELYRSGRVGLSLKKSRPGSDLPRFLLRGYRYLTLPRRTAKGKIYLVLALHALGKDENEIKQMTGCPAGTVRRYIADFEEGKKNPDLTPFFGAELKPVDLCRLHGVWHATFGDK
jgi:hypothetical protein